MDLHELVCHVETIVTTFSVLQLLFKAALMKPPSYNNLFQIMQQFFKKFDVGFLFRTVRHVINSGK